MNKKDRIHDWRKLKWPFTATFLYYSLLSLYTGTAEQSEQGFLVMFLTVLIVDAVAYFSYCYFLCKKEENMPEALVRLHSGLCAHLHTAALHPLADDDGACGRRINTIFLIPPF